MKRVKLNSRYNEENYLKEVAHNKYLLITENDHVRFGINEDNIYTFVDPSGGPFLALGDKIEECGKLTKIECIKGQGTFLTFDNNDLSSNKESGTI